MILKKNRSQRGFQWMLCLSLLAVSLTGCQMRENVITQQAEIETEEAGHEPITILTGRQNYGDFTALLKEKYPEVNLEFVSYYGGDTSSYMKESLEHGGIPDIYTVSYLPDGESQKENLLDLSSYAVVNEYTNTMLNTLNVEGGIYMLPSRYTLLGIVYNKTLMEENGWELPESFEELKALAPEIEAAGYEVVNMKSSLTGTAFGAFFALGNTNYFNTPEGAQWKKDFINGNASAEGSLEKVTDYFQQWIDAGFINTYYYDEAAIASADVDFDKRKYVFQLYSNRMTGDTTDEYGFMPFLSRDGSSNSLVRLIHRYYGLNKELGEEGNEQKLEDALKVLEVMATQEGQDALSGGNPIYVAASTINNLPEDSPYHEVLDLINSGKMVEMVYGGWEDHIVPLIENYGNPWMRGEITAADFLRGMDELNQELLAGNEADILGYVEQDLRVEETARLCAIGVGKAADADAALISLPGFHGFADGVNKENKTGVYGGIFHGDITWINLSMYAPGKGSIVTLELTGNEIKTLVETGFLVDGDPIPYDFYLATKNDMELKDDQVYTLAINNQELSDAKLLEKAVDTGITPKQAIGDYIAEIGTITIDSLIWD